MQHKTRARLLAVLCAGSLLWTSANLYALADDDDESSDDIEYLTDGDITYYLDEDDNAVIYAYTGDETEYTIPDTIDGHTVTALGGGALYGLTDLETVTIPATITSVGDSCFYGCTSLQEFIVDEDNEEFTTIDGVLFSSDEMYLYAYPAGRDDLSYTIPDGVVEIMPSAFSNTAMTEIVFPDSLLYIDTWAFVYCSLESLDFPDSLTEIGQYAFAYSTGFTEIVFPDSLELISAAAFAGCENLASVTFSDEGNLTDIQMAAFAGCAMTEVTIPESVTSIGYCAFGYEEDLETTVHNFVIYGVSGSQAETYCSEEDEENDYSNDFGFRSSSSTGQSVATDTTDTDEDADDESFWESYGRFILIAAVVVVLLAAGIYLIVSSNKKSEDTSEDVAKPDPLEDQTKTETLEDIETREEETDPLEENTDIESPNVKEDPEAANAESDAEPPEQDEA